MLTRRRKPNPSTEQPTQQSVPVKHQTKPSTKPTKGISLPKYLVHLIQNANRPLTVKELADEVERNRFPTTSKNIRKMVESRFYELVREKTLRRSADQSGYVLAKAAPMAPAGRVRDNVGLVR